MCAALPLRVIQRIDAQRALVEQDDTVREVNIKLVPDIVEGDYVLVNLGVAVQRLTEEEAEGILDLWDQVALSLLEDETDELDELDGLREEHE
jgi:hydrogenase expression/formation protein HypC